MFNYLEMLAKALKEEKIIFLPTETVFGLAAIAGSPKAYQSLVELKKRPNEKQLPIVVNSYDQIQRICEVSEKQMFLIRNFMPGPLTVILKFKKDSPYRLEGQDSVAIRYSTDNLLNNLIRLVGSPLYLTSANLSGKEPFTSALEAQKVFKDKVEFYIDGETSYNKASTIVDLSGDEIKIVREGPISLKEIEDKLK